MRHTVQNVVVDRRPAMREPRVATPDACNAALTAASPDCGCNAASADLLHDCRSGRRTEDHDTPERHGSVIAHRAHTRRQYRQASSPDRTDNAKQTRRGDRSMYKNILLPTDGSPLSMKGVKAGIAFAKALNAKVTAFYADPGIAPEFAQIDAPLPEGILEAEIARLKKVGERYLVAIEKLAQAAGVPCRRVMVSDRLAY
ncbi:MAG: universal stress protein [Betaproteobacteria bacterium]|nr:MAG: universal stress protein [Betaproteobacteria bacterium]